MREGRRREKKEEVGRRRNRGYDDGANRITASIILITAKILKQQLHTLIHKIY